MIYVCPKCNTNNYLHWREEFRKINDLVTYCDHCKERLSLDIEYTPEIRGVVPSSTH